MKTSITNRPTREALAAENDALREALDASERDLYLERMRNRTLRQAVTDWERMFTDERNLRRAAEADATSANIERAIAQAMRDLLLEANRCLPDLRGDNAWQATGPAPLFEAIERGAAA